MGLDVFMHRGHPPDPETEDPEWGEGIELPSTIHSDHPLFRIGYFRSSYNPAGINHVAMDYGLPGLYEIFSPPDDDRWGFTPDWRVAKAKCDQVLTAWRRAAERIGNLSVMKMDRFCGHPILATTGFENGTDAAEFTSEAMRKSTPDSFSQYESSKGYFFPKDPPIVRAAVQTRDWRGRNVPALIVEHENPFEFYIQALEIVMETIDYALDVEGTFYLAWSG